MISNVLNRGADEFIRSRAEKGMQVGCLGEWRRRSEYFMEGT